MGRNPERILAATALFILAISGGVVAGKVQSPAWHEVAEVRLRSGELLTAGKVQEEGDSLFIVQLDYGPRAVPKDSIARYAIRARTEEEMPPYDSRYRELEAKEKAAKEPNLILVLGVGAALALIGLVIALAG